MPPTRRPGLESHDCSNKVRSEAIQIDVDITENFIKTLPRAQLKVLDNLSISCSSKSRMLNHAYRHVRRILIHFYHFLVQKGLRVGIVKMELLAWNDEKQTFESVWVSTLDIEEVESVVRLRWPNYLYGASRRYWKGTIRRRVVASSK